MKKLLFFLMSMMLPMAASADAVEIDGVYYNLIKKIQIAGVTSNPNKYSGNIIIPEIVLYEGVEYKVTEIDSRAFYKCDGLTSVSIPNTVNTIGDYAFDGCKKMISLSISSSINTIGKYAFQNCSALTTITIPESVTSIGAYAFQGCTSLTAVHISDIAAWCNISFQFLSNPLSYAKHLYMNGDEIKHLNIPDGVSTIGVYAFYNCSGLTSLSIPNSVTTMEDCSFSGCSGLTTVSIPNSVKKIGGSAFSECSGLTSISLSNSVSTIDFGTFSRCTSLTSITIPNSVTTLNDYCFQGCTGLTSVAIPNSVTSIGQSAFSGCTSLISLSISDNVTTINEYAFSGCSSLVSLSIPDNVTTINKYAFSACSELKTISIGCNVNQILSKAFANCPELTSVSCYSKNVPNTDFDAFKDSYIEYATLQVPSSSISAYQRTEPWKNFKNIVKIDMPKHTLTYMVDGEVYKALEIEEGESIAPEPAPTKEGYIFSGWSEIPETMPAHDVTVTGAFIINKYKLIYMVDGAEYKSYEIEYGEKITPEAEATKEGYTFSGWSEIPATMPAKDVTVTGTFTINKYKLTYMVDGAEYKSYEIEYGTKITPEAEPTKEGYSFSGWSSIPETMPAKDVVVTGTFSKGAYKLTYMVDGEVYKTVSYDYGSTITPEAAPTKEGYTFSGWSDIPTTMPAKDVTVTGTFTINKYKLTYMVDDVEYKSYQIEYGAKVTPETEPTKEGYSFSGWSSIPETMPAKDVVVSGTFTKGAYKLTYMVDGEVYKTVTYDYGTTITSEAEPTKEGYTFSGWSEIPSTMPANDVTVTGTFTINKYKLTYMVDGAEYKSYEIEYGTKITPEAEPTKEGYSFSGWSSIPETMPAKDVVVTGTFTKGAYKLTYMVDGAVYKTVSYDYGATITPEAAPTKEGYTFSGWSTIPATMPAKDVTVTGTFTINKYKLTYMIDGEVYKTYEIEYGAKITPEAAPTKEGYSFSGWSSIPETMPAKDVVVSGTFTKGAYKLTYMVDGEVYKTVSYDYDATITPEAAPTKEGYTFSGWSEIPQTMPAKDVTVTGTFTINKYKLTYMVDNVEYKSYQIEYGAKITPETEPTKEGYSFSGWSSIPETMPAKDVVVTGTFTKGAYKLTYMVDGEVYKTISYDFGSTITPEAEPVKEGYTFSGWSEIPQTMPAKDITVTGTFTINKYKLTYMVDGTEYKSYDVEYGATITPEAEPTKEGYTFSGWSEIPQTMPAHDVVVTGTFIQNEQTTEFTVDDVTYDITGEGTVTITGSEQTGEVTIDATVVINGQTYRVTAIADNAFKENQSITSVTIPDGINTIGDNAFNGCLGLIVINIGKDVQTIGNKAFANVGTASAARTRSEEGMLIVNCYAESVPQTASDAFENTPIENGTLMVEDNSVNAYKATSPWSRFGRILGFDEAAGINTVSIDSPNARIYDMQGNRLDNPQKGVNIIRYKDGKVKKVMVK